MPPVIVDPESVREFATSDELERWMQKHHKSATELWIRVHKKASGLPTVTTADALDVMLCWGWIDGVRKSLNDTSFLQRYSPRQKRSPWSLINTEHVARLIKAERMQAPGHAQIEAAKSDGRWDVAYSGSKDMKTPADLMAAIDANAKARAIYDTLTSQNRYALSFRLVSLKTDAARARNIQKFVEMLARGETFYPNRPTSVNGAKKAAQKTVKKAVKSAQKSKKHPTPQLAEKVTQQVTGNVAKNVARKVASTR